MKTKTILTAIFAAVVLVIGAASVTLITLNDETPKPQVQEQTQAPTETQEQAEVVSFMAEPDKNVLEQLKAHATIETKDSEYGVFVDSINGKKGGEDGRYWTFYVDGEMAQVGAEAYVTEGGELIEWKFE